MGRNYKGTLIVKEEKEYRIYDQQDGVLYLIDYNTTKFMPSMMDLQTLEDKLADGSIKIAEDQKVWILDEDAFVSRLSPDDAEMLNNKKAFWEEVKEKAGPGLLSLVGKSPKKTWFKELYNKYEISKLSACRLVNKVIRNHPEICGLIDRRYKGAKSNSSKLKTNRKSYENRFANDEKVHILTSEDEAHMEEFAEFLKKGKYRTIDLAYHAMLDKYYSKSVIVPKGVETFGKEVKELLPPGKRVSSAQFRRFCNKQKEDIVAIRMGKEAYRNDCRRLYGRPSTECSYVGYLVEVDALDVDLNIVSDFNHDVSTSRPTIYAMRDVLSGMILAIAVTKEKNSTLGVARLVMNLLSDHVALSERFGIEMAEELWPSFVVPSVWRTDHGSDFMSHALEKALTQIGVRKESVPPRTGSYKGTIESLFNSFYTKSKPFLEGHGLITKGYKGNDVEGACLSISGLWAVAILFVRWFNGHIFDSSDRKIAPEVLKKCPDAEPSPTFLWKYWVSEKGSPRLVDDTTKTQVLFNLMEIAPCSIYRDGIHYKGLIYNEPMEDQDLRDKVLAARSNSGKRTTTGERLNSIELRRDPGSIEHLYYIKDGKLMECNLNMERSNVNLVQSLSGKLRYMTWDEYEDYLKAEKKMLTKSKEKAYVDEINYGKSVTALIEDAKKSTVTSSKNMRIRHELEKQEDNSRNTIASTIIPRTPEDTTVVDEIEAVKEEPKKLSGAQSLNETFELLQALAERPYKG